MSEAVRSTGTVRAATSLDRYVALVRAGYAPRHFALFPQRPGPIASPTTVVSPRATVAEAGGAASLSGGGMG